MAVFANTKLLAKPFTRLLYRLYSAASTFKANDLVVEVTSNPQPKPDMSNLKFGQSMSDHMLEIRWKESTGWGAPRITPYHDLTISPAAKCLHYATEVFEGMKAFYGADGQVRLFRPLENMKRMQASAERSCLPTFDKGELIECLERLIALDKGWVPKTTDGSLYIRPTMIGTEPSLGVAPSLEAILYIITGPVGPYFPTGLKPVSLLADPRYVRAWPGGAGNSKMGSNYGPTIFIQQEALKQNCQQVLWLYGADEQITEVGTMNILVFMINENGEEELVTPPLDSGVILPGVTRNSLLELARAWGDFKVSERSITMSEVVQSLKENRMLEIFGAGTACVVCPVERIHYRGDDLHIPTMKNGAPIAMRFFRSLQDIQYGRVESPFDNWVQVVN